MHLSLFSQFCTGKKKKRKEKESLKFSGLKSFWKPSISQFLQADVQVTAGGTAKRWQERDLTGRCLTEQLLQFKSKACTWLTLRMEEDIVSPRSCLRDSFIHSHKSAGLHGSVRQETGVALLAADTAPTGGAGAPEAVPRKGWVLGQIKDKEGERDGWVVLGRSQAAAGLVAPFHVCVAAAWDCPIALTVRRCLAHAPEPTFRPESCCYFAALAPSL